MWRQREAEIVRGSKVTGWQVKDSEAAEWVVGAEIVEGSRVIGWKVKDSETAE
jgi:hypothetical protein